MAVNVYERQNPYPRIMSDLLRIASGRNQAREELTARQAEAQANREFQAGQARLARDYQTEQNRLNRIENAAERKAAQDRLDAQLQNQLGIMTMQHNETMAQIKANTEAANLARTESARQFDRLHGTDPSSVVIDDPRARGLMGPEQVDYTPGTIGAIQEQANALYAAQAERDKTAAELQRDATAATISIADINAATQLAMSKATNETERERIRSAERLAKRQIASGEKVSLAQLENTFSLGQGELSLRRDAFNLDREMVRDLTSSLPTPPRETGLFQVPEDVREGLRLGGYNVGPAITVSDALGITSKGVKSVENASLFQELVPFLGQYVRSSREKKANDALSVLESLARIEQQNMAGREYDRALNLETARRGFYNR